MGHHSSVDLPDGLLPATIEALVYYMPVATGTCGSAPDFWYEEYDEDKDWPDEFKEWFVRTLAWDAMYEYIEGLKALREALQEEDASCERKSHLRMLCHRISYETCKVVFPCKSRPEQRMALQVGSLCGPWCSGFGRRTSGASQPPGYACSIWHGTETCIAWC